MVQPFLLRGAKRRKGGKTFRDGGRRSEAGGVADKKARLFYIDTSRRKKDNVGIQKLGAQKSIRDSGRPWTPRGTL